MAKIEVDENEYAELRRVGEVAQLIGKDPKARALLQEAVALAAPDQAGPETRIRREVNERLGAFEQKFDEFLAGAKKDKEDREAADQTKALEQRWLTQRAAARDAGYTDDGLQKLEEFMEKNGIADHSIAIPAFEKLNPPPEPVATGSSHWNFFDQREQGVGEGAFKALMEGNDEAFLAATIPNALKEVRGR